jgi:hypothetical protein
MLDKIGDRILKFNPQDEDVAEGTAFSKSGEA